MENRGHPFYLSYGFDAGHGTPCLGINQLGVNEHRD